MTADISILCAAGMLVTAYLMVGQKALFTAIRLYGLQSALLGLLAATSAYADGRHDLYVTAALTIVLKGLVIPWFLMRVIDRVGIHREIEPFLNVPASLLVCLGLTVVGYRVSTGFPEGARATT
jgi:hydrogenase-4 component E